MQNFYTYPIQTYSQPIEVVSDSLSKNLPAEFVLTWSIILPDQIIENPYPYYPWREKTGKSLGDFRLFLSDQRALMRVAIQKTEEELMNAVR